MKALAFALIASALMVASADARVGETFDELVKRFGPTSKPLTTSFGVDDWVFNFKDWVIHVRLLNGRSAWEQYYIAGPSREFSQTDVDAVLGANSRGKQWKAVTEYDWDGMHAPVSPGYTAWKLEGEPLTAVRNERGHCLTIISKEWNDYAAALFEKEKQSAKKAREKAVKDSGL
jgi:hypothetical protein